MPPGKKRKLLQKYGKLYCTAGNMDSHLTSTRTGQAYKAKSDVNAWMNKKERKLIKEIYRDCLKLKKIKELTEFGYGEMMVCETLLGKAIERS